MDKKEKPDYYAQSTTAFALSGLCLCGSHEFLSPPPILCYCLKVTQETIAPQKLFSQVKCQMRTGKSGTNLKVMHGETPYTTDLLWWRGCPLGRWKVSINVWWSHEPGNSGIVTSGLFIMCFKVCRRATQKLFFKYSQWKQLCFPYFVSTLHLGSGWKSRPFPPFSRLRDPFSLFLVVELLGFFPPS